MSNLNEELGIAKKAAFVILCVYIAIIIFIMWGIVKLLQFLKVIHFKVI